VSEEKKGRVKFTLEVEINEALMDIVRESMKNMPQTMQMLRTMRREGKSTE
jgi:hypothetical protein